MGRIFTMCAIAGGLALCACSPQNLQKNGLNGSSSTNDVYLERDYQKVVTYDCHHNVIKDDIETVKSPTAWEEITPKDSTNIADSDFVDEQTGSRPTIFNYTDFQVDYSSGFLNMHVVSGPNVIDYTFYSCSQWTTDQNNNKVCAVPEKVEETGKLTINVHYVEKNLSGELDVTDCPSGS